MPSKPFTVYRRPTRKKKRFIYYIQFRDEHGKRKTAVSSGKTNRADAECWAYQRTAERSVQSPKKQKFKDYASNWFLWEKCEYVERRRSRRNYCRSYADKQRAYLRNHILPYFRNRELCSITDVDIDRWLLKVKKQYSPATANRALSVLKIMMKEAKRRRLISENPAAAVEKLAEKPRVKGILELSEFRLLFDPEKVQDVWDGSLFHYALNMLASVTGLRMGEIQAIRWQCVHENYIQIDRSWDRKYGLKEPTAQSHRFASIPPVIHDCLSLLRRLEPLAEDDVIVFHGDNLHQPIDHKVVEKRLYRAFSRIGITEEQRRSRNLTFHSWRHFLNSNLRSLVADPDLQKLTGHRTLAMTNHYDHVTAQAIARVRPHQETLLGIDRNELLAVSR